MDQFLIKEPEVNQINLNLRTFLVVVFLLKDIPVIGYQVSFQYVYSTCTRVSKCVTQLQCTASEQGTYLMLY